MKMGKQLSETHEVERFWICARTLKYILLWKNKSHYKNKLWEGSCLYWFQNTNLAGCNNFTRKYLFSRNNMKLWFAVTNSTIPIHGFHKRFVFIAFSWLATHCWEDRPPEAREIHNNRMYRKPIHQPNSTSCMQQSHFTATIHRQGSWLDTSK